MAPLPVLKEVTADVTGRTVNLSHFFPYFTPESTGSAESTFCVFRASFFFPPLLWGSFFLLLKYTWDAIVY